MQNYWHVDYLKPERGNSYWWESMTKPPKMEFVAEIWRLIKATGHDSICLSQLGRARVIKTDAVLQTWEKHLIVESC